MPQGSCESGSVALPANDPYASGQRELALMGAGSVMNGLRARAPRRPALVAVIDTGVAGGHEDLREIMWPRAIDDDRLGHGTAVASLIGAVADNRRGIASFNLEGRYVRVQSFPALGGPRPGADDVAAALEDALDAGASVINLSFGAVEPAPSVVRAAVARAIRAGVIVVASAGNGAGLASDQWPANIPGVLVVGATDSAGVGRATFSKRTEGLALAVSAPGEGVCAGSLGGGYAKMSGTSMSAPLVAGLLGMMKALCPGLRPDEAARLLIQTGAPLPGSGLGPRVDAERALEALLRGRTDCSLGAIAPSWSGSAWEVGRGSYDTGD